MDLEHVARIIRSTAKNPAHLGEPAPLPVAMKRLVFLAGLASMLTSTTYAAVPPGAPNDGDFTLIYDCATGGLAIDGPAMASYTTFSLEIIDSPTGQPPPAGLVFDPTQVFWFP